jgi:hypothetical protein
MSHSLVPHTAGSTAAFEAEVARWPVPWEHIYDSKTVIAPEIIIEATINDKKENRYTWGWDFGLHSLVQLCCLLTHSHSCMLYLPKYTPECLLCPGLTIRSLGCKLTLKPCVLDEIRV